MARTVAEAITRARAAIGDATGERANTATCEGYVRDALNLIMLRRPDLFLGRFADGIDELASADDLPIDGSAHFLAIASFVAAMIESQDDQSADRARGELMSKLGVAHL